MHWFDYWSGAFIGSGTVTGGGIRPDSGFCSGSFNTFDDCCKGGDVGQPAAH